MPSSFADVTLDWEGILAALREHPDLLAVLEAEKLALERDLADIRNLKAQQERQTALRQELTQKIKGVRAHGSGMVIAIRAVAKGKIGYRNERLVYFGSHRSASGRRGPGEWRSPSRRGSRPTAEDLENGHAVPGSVRPGTALSSKSCEMEFMKPDT